MHGLQEMAATRTTFTVTPYRNEREAETCYWDGTAPFCAGACPPGYTERNRNTCGDGACCWTGYKVYCCK
ncbi:hypothetical protein GCM10023195_64860 [Actinoallomurus liliacearum]|uniref:Uncharacterized protein n=2 Tax=Actinoallomurus liliacearum TaxID=1080073 RepID=A0ABP8TTP0_9ACTN